MPEDSFTSQGPLIEQALFNARSAAVTVDLTADTQLVNAVKQTEDKYRDLWQRNNAMAEEVRAEIDNFLKLDFAGLKNPQIPFAHRFRTVKAVATKILDAVAKSDKIVKDAREVKESLAALKPDGDNFTELDPASMGTITKTSVNLEEKLEDLESAWKKVDVDTAAFDTYVINDVGDGANEEAFIPGVMLAVQSMKTVLEYLNKI